MKTKLLILAILFPSFGHASLLPWQTQSNEYWMTTNATGNVLGYSFTDAETGLDGSNQTNFDRNLNVMPPNSVLHLAPGAYYTTGNLGFNAAPGLKLLGSGMDFTIIRFATNTVASFAGQSWHNFYTEKTAIGNSNTVIRDLTFDANYQPGELTTLGGMQLFGSGNTVSHVKLENLASFTTSQTNYVEDFGVLITSGSNNVIEDCWVTGYSCNFFNNLSALGLDGVNYNGRLSGNLIVQTGSSNYVYGLGCIGSKFLVNYNVVSNCVIAYHADTVGGSTNLELVGNEFDNPSTAVFIANSTNVNLTLAFNSINMGGPMVNFNYAMMHLDGSAVFLNTIIFGNTVSFGNYPTLPPLVEGDNATGLAIQNNVVQNGLSINLTKSSGLLINGNITLTNTSSAK